MKQLQTCNIYDGNVAQNANVLELMSIFQYLFVGRFYKNM